MRIEIENIYNDIIELSDLGIQRRAWLGEDPTYISSYVELMNRLFDDNGFDQFLDETAPHLLSQETVGELLKLRTLLSDYREKATDIEILNDPEWTKVVFQARNVMQYWVKDLPDGKNWLK